MILSVGILYNRFNVLLLEFKRLKPLCKTYIFLRTVETVGYVASIIS